MINHNIGKTGRRTSLTCAKTWTLWHVKLLKQLKRKISLLHAHRYMNKSNSTLCRNTVTWQKTSNKQLFALSDSETEYWSTHLFIYEKKAKTLKCKNWMTQIKLKSFDKRWEQRCSDCISGTSSYLWRHNHLQIIDRCVYSEQKMLFCCYSRPAISIGYQD